MRRDSRTNTDTSLTDIRGFHGEGSFSVVKRCGFDKCVTAGVHVSGLTGNSCPALPIFILPWLPHPQQLLFSRSLESAFSEKSCGGTHQGEAQSHGLLSLADMHPDWPLVSSRFDGSFLFITEQPPCRNLPHLFVHSSLAGPLRCSPRVLVVTQVWESVTGSRCPGEHGTAYL